MSEPFLAEIRVFPFDYAPRGWALCAGQVLAINQNQALFSLLGTTYGGDGSTTFALPDLRGRTAVGQGDQVGLGEVGGEESHALTPSEAAHGWGVSTPATTSRPQGAIPANGGAYASPADGSSGAPVGGGQPHENRAPFLAVSFCIALQGIFPSRN